MIIATRATSQKDVYIKPEEIEFIETLEYDDRYGDEDEVVLLLCFKSGIDIPVIDTPGLLNALSSTNPARLSN